ncbi:helix-turn-helix domain-containing protein [Alicyclobacillus sp. SO9]|uniref:helix-turn-helix domain-containing protein n=1 Tax=Alicyclobacillus sp. SO9 TaxID=2665646 RepID=UPI0018E7AFBB|nr:helix-turn-helix transcriptional regulator [Alicyclobacillus sp. SO9]QQE78093.1 helix-turn-helix transcriptional regulator [Alicyclobacillus sp. SO9]
MANFPERLSTLIKSKGVQKKELAEKLGISYRNLRHYELGERKPDFDGLTKLADFFDVSVDYLVGRSDDPNPDKETDPEQAEFLRWVEENLEGSFYYDFKSSPDDAKRHMMETLRLVWEREKGRKPRQKQGE